MDADNHTERFAVTNGRVFGVLGLLAGVAFVVSGALASPLSWGTCAAGLLVAVLAWVVLLRPVVGVDQGALVLRGMLSTVSIPLAAVEQVAVRQVLVVRAGDRRYANPAVGRGRREMVRESHPGRRGSGSGLGFGALSGNVGAPVPTDPDGPAAQEGGSYGVYVESRVRELAADARRRAGVADRSDEQAALAVGVRREWAVPEVAAVVLAVLAVVLVIVL